MGMEVLQEKLVARCWRLPVSLAKQLKLSAASNGKTIEQTVIEAIERHLAVSAKPDREAGGL